MNDIQPTIIISRRPVLSGYPEETHVREAYEIATTVVFEVLISPTTKSTFFRYVTPYSPADAHRVFAGKSVNLYPTTWRQVGTRKCCSILLCLSAFGAPGSAAG
jgi:hypothetical protein